MNDVLRFSYASGYDPSLNPDISAWAGEDNSCALAITKDGQTVINGVTPQAGYALTVNTDTYVAGTVHTIKSTDNNPQLGLNFNVGPETASSGTWIRDSALPMVMLQDTGTLTDYGALDILYKPDWSGGWTGFCFAQAFDTSGGNHGGLILIKWNNGNFEAAVEFASVWGMFSATEGQGGYINVCIGQQPDGTNSMKLTIENMLGATAKISYWLIAMPKEL
jgi:hypothetical protein